MAIDPADLHTQACFEDPFPVWERLRHDQPPLHGTVDDRWPGAEPRLTIDWFHRYVDRQVVDVA